MKIKLSFQILCFVLFFTVFMQCDNPTQSNSYVSELQTIPLYGGWNWISFNVENQDMSTANVFDTIKDNLLVIVDDKNNTEAFYSDSSGWMGGNFQIDIRTYYNVQMLNSDTLRLWGIPVNISTFSVELDSGFNYIGFPLQDELNVDIALSLLPNLSNEDILKQQTLFTQFTSEFGWLGSLENMRPGHGYLLRVSSPQTLTYPILD
ncbi:MAG: hypothetical protein HN600_09140 [Bacteroidetes bacterium]|jgi:hypothetical protein|nr:hypothetical protein [Bacteroidota bacterium]